MVVHEAVADSGIDLDVVGNLELGQEAAQTSAGATA
jgi:hypothetical protein